MTTLVEVGKLHKNDDGWSQHNDGPSVQTSDNDEGLGRSYVCSMSSIIDLNENNANLALNVQRYLSRIIEELHLISAWSSSIYQHQPTPVSVEKSEKTDDSSLTAMARLAVVTDIALMRRDVAQAQHELFQRCSSQMAHVQNEISASIKKQEAKYDELKQLIDDKQRTLDQQTQAIQALKKTREKSDAQINGITSTMHKIQQQASIQTARVSTAEKSIATVSTAQVVQMQDLQTLQRRVENFESTHQLQVQATHAATEDSLAGLRSAHSQLSAKMQVIRLEMQELNESTEKRMQQLLKAVASVMASVSGKSLSTGAVAPRRPSVATTRTPRSGGNTRLSQTSGTEASSSSLDSFRDEIQTLMDAEADPVGTTDCFIYAKAALPHYKSASEISSLKKDFSQSTGSIRASTKSPGVTVASETKSQDVMTNLLTVKQSVLSVPLGYEADTCLMTNDKHVKESNEATGKSDPILSTKRSTRRLSSSQFKTSRLHTKL